MARERFMAKKGIKAPPLPAAVQMELGEPPKPEGIHQVRVLKEGEATVYIQLSADGNFDDDFDKWFPKRVGVEAPKGYEKGPSKIDHGKTPVSKVPTDWAKIFEVDPRPDLPGSKWWNQVLRALKAIDGDNPHGFFGAIHGLRCVDAIGLAPAQKGVHIVTIDRQAYAPVRARIIADEEYAQSLDAVLSSVVQ